MEFPYFLLVTAAFKAFSGVLGSASALLDLGCCGGECADFLLAYAIHSERLFMRLELVLLYCDGEYILVRV